MAISPKPISVDLIQINFPYESYTMNPIIGLLEYFESFIEMRLSLPLCKSPSIHFLKTSSPLPIGSIPLYILAD